MSRNLCRTDCYYCHGGVKLMESPRAVTKEDCGVYFDEYAGMIVANAECGDCGAKYLAWVDEAKRVPMRRWGTGFYRSPEYGATHVDLSFRSTFDDETGRDDLPRWRVRETIVRERVGTFQPPAGDRYWEFSHADVLSVAPTSGKCEHVEIGPGPRMPLLYGSAPTEICLKCGMWRDARRPRDSYPYPKALHDWRPATELLKDIARGDDRA